MAILVTVQISDASDERLRPYLHLTDVALRSTWEPEHGLFVAEGDATIRRALGAGYRPISGVCLPEHLARLAAALSSDKPPGELEVPELEVPLLVVPAAVLEQVTGFRVHRGPLAVFARQQLPELAELLSPAGARLLLVLEDLVDHTNVGACLRSAAAFGVAALLLAPRTSDPLYRRAIRTSMGAVFSVPWTRVEHWWSLPDTLAQHGYTVLALTPSAAATPLPALPPGQRERVALLVGGEGPGLSRRWLETATLQVRIPMPGADRDRQAIDSLNVAAAVAVACYELTRI